MRPALPRSRRALGALVALALAACTDGTSPGPARPPLLAALPRPLTSAETDAVSGSTRFGLTLLREVNRDLPAENALVSPLSASYALCMVLNGAAGATRDSMRAVLGWTGRTDDEVNAAYTGLTRLLATVDPLVKFTNANSAWVDDGFPLRSTFVQVLRDTFGADARSLDLQAPGTPALLNAWASANTNGRIPSIVDQLDPSEVLVLVNALWFKGTWRDSFRKDSTLFGTLPLTSSALIPFMRRDPAVAGLGNALGATVVDLPYGNGAWRMTLVMPAGDLNAFVDSLDVPRWNALIGSVQDATYALEMPRFTLDRRHDLGGPLARAGMGIAFTPAADFSRLSPIATLVTDVVQRTWMQVDEIGTEAAAVTKAGVGVVSAPPTVRVDRPFVLAIRERFSGTLLFLGAIKVLR
jgi:serpin B